MGNMNKKTHMPLKRILVKAKQKANSPPNTKDIPIPSVLVYKLFHRARHVLGAEITFHKLLSAPWFQSTRAELNKRTLGNTLRISTQPINNQNSPTGGLLDR